MLLQDIALPCLIVVIWPQPAIKCHTAAHSLSLPAQWDGEENQKKVKLVYRGKNSLLI